MSPKNHRPKERERESPYPPKGRGGDRGKGRSVGQEGERGGAKMGKTANQGIGREGGERERRGESHFFFWIEDFFAGIPRFSGGFFRSVAV